MRRSDGLINRKVIKKDMNNTPNDNRSRVEAQRQQSYPRPRPGQNGQRPNPSGQRPAPNGRPHQSGQSRPAPSRRPIQDQRTAPIGYRPSSRRASDDKLLWFLIIEVILLIALIVTFIIVKSAGDGKIDPDLPKETEPSIPAGPAGPSGVENPDNLPVWNSKPSDPKAFVPKTSDDTLYAQNLNSEYAILVSLSDNSVVASKKSDQKMYPASMTKIMTVIVACENITDMKDTFTITEEIRIPLDNSGASMAWFKINQPITLIDLIYGAWLPSGADGTAALAIKIAGSEEAFVKMMNDKAAEIGCTGTHFTNASGLHNENHYSTARDMAIIMAYAVNNPFIKQVMCSRTYETAAKLEKSENKLYATWYSSMPSDYSFFMGAKTGYEDAAGSCMASLIKAPDGKEYVIVTGKALYPGRENTFKDVKTLYDSYVK